MRGHLPPVVPTSAHLCSLPQYMKNEKVKVLIIQLCWTLSDPKDCTARLLCPWNSPGKNTGVGLHSLLQGIFLT